MRLKATTFTDDEDMTPSKHTVEMTAEEVALISAFFGAISPKQMSDAGCYGVWLDAFDALANGSWNIGVRFYEDGYPQGTPRGVKALIVPRAT